MSQKEKPKTDPQGRKWVITLNNPAAHGYTEKYIKDVFTNKLKVQYFCFGFERGLLEDTPHAHVYVYAQAPLRFSTLQRHFPKGHFEKAYGSNTDNINYVEKTGKWANDSKADTAIPGTFFESGERPSDRKYSNNDLADIFHLIIDGASNGDILREFPHHIRSLRDIEYARQILREEEHRNKSRPVVTTFITGPTGVGKTFRLMNDPNLGKIHRVTDYTHPWDTYSGQDTVILDEYQNNNNLKIGELLNVCDIFPLILRARFSPKVATFTKVYIVSNLELNELYPDVRVEQPRVWDAFMRRVKNVIVYTDYKQFKEFTLVDYFKYQEEVKRIKAQSQAGPKITKTRWLLHAPTLEIASDPDPDPRAE